MTTIGEALALNLVKRNVEVVFGIPGVHTIELYRGLVASGIRHITPRHEQGAGFMADGYARVSGKPGVAFVITGPGVTNILTAVAQARADSIPMLVISGVNPIPSLGKALGHLHELPDQSAVAAAVSNVSIRIESQEDIAPALDRAFATFSEGRPGPAHIEVPLDIAKREYSSPGSQPSHTVEPTVRPEGVADAIDWLRSARRPVILAGGGVSRHDQQLTELASYLDAPTVLTVNARGLMHGHPLVVPASPSLNVVRNLIEDADTVLALGTEMGPTDYDIYATGSAPVPKRLIRIDICSDQLDRRPADLKIHADAGDALETMLAQRSGNDQPSRGGIDRAAAARAAAFQEIGPEMRGICRLLDTLRDGAPGSIIIGDSTQPIYAGNMYYDHDHPGGWFNSATGYGALGYAIPAAIGAAIAKPGHRVLCLTGDGGAQFCLPELMVAVREQLPIVFIIWNNWGYQEIATAMRDAGIAPVGCAPTPPDFGLVAASCGMGFLRCEATASDIAISLSAALSKKGPVLIEIDATGL